MARTLEGEIFLFLLLCPAALLFFMFPAFVHAEQQAAPDALEFGPLLIRSEAPAQALRLAPVPRSPYLPEPGANRFRIALNLSSIFADPEETYFIDMQTADLQMAVMHGFRSNWALELGLSERRVVKTKLDDLTIAFHDLFNIDQSGRDEVPRNDTRISFPDYGLELDERDITHLSRSVEATLMKTVVTGESGSVAVGFAGTVRYELLENGPVEVGAVDGNIQVSLAKGFGRSAAFLNVAYTRFGSDRFLDVIPLETSQLTGIFSFVFKTRVNQAFLVQYLVSQGGFVDLGELAEPVHEVHVGYKWRNGPRMWELGLVENVVNLNNSPDVGFSLGFSHGY